ncbi:isocitrate/isopropylmalate family dehydrogenase [Paraglaciecola aquimarina]|uniref:Isocitrate/isopropylmalate family dehydrogenase n=1 Tax=Paraglaciecola aquimarina TaxID=1235557 RepID=A0ABU3SYC9_9ALTE|nr:isocitrate/isopropylmalate family dehydrogenase [Paraglaciecola aquimarina]MDU0355015.1 isocitrate/isopropylmalate family dehydrogenase [Paraglaciecola aquimarina]
MTDICLTLLNEVSKKVGQIELHFSIFAAGATHYKETGISLPEEAMQHAFNSDATLLACMGLPSIRYPDGREIAPQLELREKMDLFAGVRPVKTMLRFATSINL